MILTRLKLDTENRNTSRGLSNPNVFHGAIERGQIGERSRILWRHDTIGKNNYLLILSERPLDCKNLADQFCRVFQDVEFKDYEVLLDRVTEGSKWRFRLVANPTESKISKSESTRGKIKCHYKMEDQEEWLKKKAKKSGFRLDAFAIKGSRKRSIRKKGQSQRVSFQEVVYEGILTVTDAAAFKKALVSGIGRGKAYGMGMMTIVSYHE